MKTIFLGSFLLFSFTRIFSQNSDLRITPLVKNYYVYVTYGTYHGQKVPANAMYVVTDSGVILFDTPWDSTQFQPLLDSIWQRHHKKVIMCISTHFHEDRTGGLEYYRKMGIKTYTTEMTDDLSRENHMKRAQYLIKKDTVFAFGKNTFQTYYPGPGHTRDNIVIWIPAEKILYGGCLIKSVDDNSLGNLDDADINQYAHSVENVLDKYGDANFIITGHNSWKDKRSLRHTLEMAKKLTK